MPIKPILFSLILILLYKTLIAQVSISGHVVDLENKPLPLVMVILQQQELFVAGTNTDEEGGYRLSHGFERGKAYAVKFTLVGYRPVIRHFIYPDTGFHKRIILLPDNKLLNEVTVSAQRPMIIRKADRFIIDVENSLLANGNSGFEVLKKSPGLWVSDNGSIRIKGNQPVTVMINDVVQRMSEEELADYLKTLKSEDVSKIEVIANPPAEFEASGTGGVVHIVLKKARKDGFNGSLYGRYMQQGNRPYASAGTSLNYKLKDLYLFGSYSYTSDRSRSVATTDILYPDKGIYNSRTDRNNINSRQQYRIGAAYDLGNDQSLGIQTTGTLNRSDQNFVTGIHYRSGGLDTRGAANSAWWKAPGLSSTTLNYLWKTDTSGSQLKVIVDYTRSNKDETNNFSSVYDAPDRNATYRNSTPNSTAIYNMQADYTAVLKHKTEIRAGAKYSAVKRDNSIIREDYVDQHWVPNTAGSNHFIYHENLLMAYSSLEKMIKRTAVKIGLRVEQTFTKGNSVSSGQHFTRNYLGLFPSVFIMQTLNERKGSALYINYSRRLQRPSFNDLNPYRLQLDDYTAILGNPDLLPQYTHNVSIGYSFLNNYSADVYFSRTSNMIGELANPAGNTMIEYQARNFDNSTEYGFNFSAPVKILKNWTVNNSFSLYNLSYRIHNFAINQTTFYGKSVHTITLKKLIDIEAWADYRSPYVQANSRIPHMFSFDLGFTKKVLDGQGRLRLYFSDVFNTLREMSVTDYNDTHIDFYQKRPTRTVSVSFTYNFSGGRKFKDKKIDQGSSSDENSRIGN
jgi:outer membrane receptor protein involved in Fe transport